MSSPTASGSAYVEPGPGPSTEHKTKHNTNCCVYECHSRKGADRSTHFHYFAKQNSGITVKIVNKLGQEESLDKRKAWEKVLLMGKPVTASMRVCSKHFRKEDYCAKAMSLMERKQDLLEECKSKFPKTFQTSCLFWLPAQTVNFAVIPSVYRVTYISCCSFAWINILCWLKREEVAVEQ